jgi:hypothetical protein
MLFVNAVIGTYYLIAMVIYGKLDFRVPISSALMSSPPFATPEGPYFKVPGWSVFLSVIGAFLITICTVALFRWRKWGFYGVCAVAAVIFTVNLLSGVGPLLLLGPVGVVVLYAVLNLGGGKKAWPRLR